MSARRFLISSPLLVAMAAGAAAQEPRPTPRASFATVDSTSPPRMQLETYIASLRFLSDHVSSDERAIGSQTVARIEPEIGAHLLSDADLREGRIIARLVNAGARSPRFALERKGMTYLWVKRQGPTDRGTGVGMLVSTDSGGRITGVAEVGFGFDPVGHAPTRQPLARWRTYRQSSDSGSAKVDANGACSICGTSWCRGDTSRTRSWVKEH